MLMATPVLVPSARPAVLAARSRPKMQAQARRIHSDKARLRRRDVIPAALRSPRAAWRSSAMAGRLATLAGAEGAYSDRFADPVVGATAQFHPITANPIDPKAGGLGQAA